MAIEKVEPISTKAFELLLRKLEMTEKRQEAALAETRVQLQAIQASIDKSRSGK